MRALTSLPLDDDIVDRLLGLSPDFGTPLALLLTCKYIHSVFSARLKSIARVVAYNVAGPALNDAVRALRPSVHEGPGGSSSHFLDTLSLSAAEKHGLKENARVLHGASPFA